MTWLDPFDRKNADLLESEESDTVDALREKNEKLQKMYSTILLNYRRERNFRLAESKFCDNIEENFRGVLQKYGLLDEFFDYSLQKDCIEILCKALVSTRAKNKKLKWRIKLLSKQAASEVVEVADQMIRAARAERWTYDDEIVKTLADRNRNLQREINIMREALEEKNLKLDSMHYVWCDGGCPGGTHRYDGKGPESITEEIVTRAERNVRRLRTWFTKFQYKHNHRS